MIKRTKEDKVFSDLIRRRANWKCEYCGKDFENDKIHLHCSHIIPRKHKSLRWLPENAVAHCFECHNMLEKTRHVMKAWVKEKYNNMHLLEQRKNKVMKISKTGLEELYQHLKGEWDNGALDFTVPDWYKL